MEQKRFRGTGVALVTPLKDGKVDYPALEKVIEHVIEGGVEFLVSLGTTGEAVTLTTEECREVLDFTIKVNNRRLPIVAGIFGGNDTAAIIRRIEGFNFDGIDAIMSSGPAYNKPTQRGIYEHYMAIEKVSPLPVIIYNVPGRTSKNIKAETTLKLAHASKKFIAVKEASGNLPQVMKILKDRPKGFLVLSGDDPTALPLVTCGGDGLISVIGNAFPGIFSNMIRAALAGDLPQAKRLNDQLLDVHPWLYIDGNPAGIKSVLNMMNICSTEVRLPLVPMTSKNLKRLKESINDLL